MGIGPAEHGAYTSDAGLGRLIGRDLSLGLGLGNRRAFRLADLVVEDVPSRVREAQLDHLFELFLLQHDRHQTNNGLLIPTIPGDAMWRRGHGYGGVVDTTSTWRRHGGIDDGSGGGGCDDDDERRCANIGFSFSASPSAADLQAMSILVWNSRFEPSTMYCTWIAPLHLK
jgi:hypothetical protein